ncbi:MAG TPA: hypothetical protein VGQ59_18345 [Cyclobacteriaceae bacterium]|jgi:hypothetical protein|nr:hypothetical protein [Cyclobacteriaceae bacterium]
MQNDSYQPGPNEVYREEYLKRRREKELQKKRNNEIRRKRVLKVNKAIACLTFLFSLVALSDFILPSIQFQEEAIYIYSNFVRTSTWRRSGYRDYYCDTENWRLQIPEEFFAKHSEDEKCIVVISITPILDLPKSISEKSTPQFTYSMPANKYIIIFSLLLFATSLVLLIFRTYSEPLYSFSYGIYVWLGLVLINIF